MVELKRAWFPLLVAAFWVLMVAATLTNFASFSGTARAQDSIADKAPACAAAQC